MAISRMQEPRQLYGLGSFVKSIGKGVKKFVKKYNQAGQMAAHGGLDPHDDNKWEERAEKWARKEYQRIKNKLNFK